MVKKDARRAPGALIRPAIFLEGKGSGKTLVGLIKVSRPRKKDCCPGQTPYRGGGGGTGAKSNWLWLIWLWEIWQKPLDFR